MTTGNPALPGVNGARSIEQIQFNLSHLRGGDSTIGVGDAWTNPGNAIDGTVGKHNGTVATRSGSLTAGVDGALTLTYPDMSAGKTLLAITSVKIHWYAQQTGTVANNGGIRYGYSTNNGGAYTNVFTSTGNINHLSTPFTQDITAVIGGDWALINALRTRCRLVTAIGASTVQAQLDAIEIEVTADLTWVP